MTHITTIFKGNMKMSDLIDADYHLLLLLDRLGFAYGFSEKSVNAVCKEYNFDTNCFIFLANLQSKKGIDNIEETFDRLPLEPFLYYLKSSHNYFLDERLPNIRRKLEKVFTDGGNKDVSMVVMQFFDKYTAEVLEHMRYEDNVVFPYVDSLILHNEKVKYSIDTFEEVHSDIEGKMNDLIQILMKYISNVPNRTLMTNILMELYMTGDELESHRYLEDSLVIPRVKRLEAKG